MIEIFRWRKEPHKEDSKPKWRIKITDETLEFETKAKFEKALKDIINIKEEFEPNK